MPTVLHVERHPVADEAAYRPLLDVYVTAMRDAPGVLWADAAKATDDEPSWIVLSEWRTDGDLESFLGTEGAETFLRAADVALRGDVTRRRFASTG